MTIDQIKAFLQKDWDIYKEIFSNSLVSGNTFLTSINEYLSLSNGKQVRPILALLSAKLCGTPTKYTFLNAAVVEITHNATLLHDDVADDSPLRRGKETVQYKYGKGPSILMGDYYLVSALYEFAKLGANYYINKYIEAVRRMCEGEMFQLEKAEQLNTTEEDYYYIIDCKTVMLFRLAMQLGVHSVEESNPWQEELMGKMAWNIGCAFQIRDDILDYSPGLEIGKPVLLDIKEGKITLPLLKAMNQLNISLADSKPLILQAKNGDDAALQEIADIVKRGDGIEQAQQSLVEHSQQAKELLQQFAPSTERECMDSIIEMLTKRTI